MSRIRRVAVLLHERQRDALDWPYRIWAMARTWEQRGIHVEPAWGIDRPIHADLLIPHIDLSYIPDDYWQFIQQFPGPAVNRGVRDIRKRVFSTLTVKRDDGYDGPVIVKTDCNSGGRPERKILGEGAPRSLRERIGARLARWPSVERRNLASARTLRQYHIFDRASEVPPNVFENPALIVERFVPELENGRYALRLYTFFGDRDQVRIFWSPEPFVKTRRAQMGHPLPIPEEVREWRRRLGLDYGKLDYVIHEGRAHLLDVNTAVGMRGEINVWRIGVAAPMAEGIAYFERDGAGISCRDTLEDHGQAVDS